MPTILLVIIAVLVLLWLFGWAGPRYYSGIPETGGFLHVLLVIAAILLVLYLLGAI